MMEEDFLAVLKLVSGEEILSTVCVCDEYDRIILALDNPIVMKEHETPIGTIVKVEPWFKFNKDTLYFIDMDKVITISEVTDEKIVNVYGKYIKSSSKDSNKIKLTKSMGYISKLDDFRKDLEKIYKSSSN
jgi:hypothetical protein